MPSGHRPLRRAEEEAHRTMKSPSSPEVIPSKQADEKPSMPIYRMLEVLSGTDLIQKFRAAVIRRGIVFGAS